MRWTRWARGEQRDARTLDRAAQGPNLPRMPRWHWGGLFALLLTAAAVPPAAEVQHVPPEQTIAILGHGVADAEGKEIGRIVDVLVSSRGEPQAAVIDFGGFMGVGDRKIAVQWSALHFAPADAKQPITLDLTQDQLKAAPEYKDVAKPAPVVSAPETPR
jgi:PRC-barrel domain